MILKNKTIRKSRAHSNNPSIVAVLQNIRSLHNVGSIFRTADAAGVLKIYLCGITPTPIDRFGSYRKEIAKVALCGERYVPWEYGRSILPVIRRLRKEGYLICAVEQSRKSIPYYRLRDGKLPLKIALVLGSEVRGLSPRVLRAADRILEIPMAGEKESLNVAVAFGIVVFGIRF